uniref:DNA-directed RNA polymerase n=1 Tax=Rotundella rotunda TaxID=1357779 RepID=A0A140GII5_9CHLO|nr:alpha subunit of RNA polymerase [Rotundella rotunda]
MENFFLSCKECIKETPLSIYGCFYLGPFNNSQSLTVANALRRTLLSEIPGIGVLHLEIDGVAHEYTTVKGLRESVLDVLLNFKQIVLKKANKISLNKPLYGYLSVRGPGIIRASDLRLPPSIQCVDPNQYIATLNEDGKIVLKFTIVESKNKSLKPFFEKNSDLSLLKKRSEEITVGAVNTNKKIEIKNTSLTSFFKDKSPKNALFVDPLFNPIHKVNYTIQPYGPLKENKENQIVIIELWTNGSLYPREALYLGLTKLKNLFFKLDEMKLIHSLMVEANFKDKQNYTKMLRNVEHDYTHFKNTKKRSTKKDLYPEMVFKLQNLENENIENPKISQSSTMVIPTSIPFVQVKDNTGIEDLFLPYRIYNCLKKNHLSSIEDLIQYSPKQLLELPGFGNYCLIILEENLKKKGLHLNLNETMK